MKKIVAYKESFKELYNSLHQKEKDKIDRDCDSCFFMTVNNSSRHPGFKYETQLSTFAELNNKQ